MNLTAEIEAKFLDVDPGFVRAKLKTLGADCIVPERMMTRVVFHDPNIKSGEQRWGRVRDEGGGKVTMSIKEVKDANSVTGTQEYMEEVESVEAGVRKMAELGYEQTARQETLRESWKLGDIDIELDRWPGLPYWVEIEAESEEIIMDMARKLGIADKEKMYASADYVYEKVYGIPGAVINKLPEILFADEEKFKRLAEDLRGSESESR